MEYNNESLVVVDAVLGLEEHRELAVGSPRAPAHLPELSQNDFYFYFFVGIEKCKHS